VTDQQGRAVAGLPIVFSLSTPDGKSLGAIGAGGESAGSYSAVTDASGVATAPFTAGAAAGAAVVSASVPGTSATSSRPVAVSDGGKKTLIPVLATVAAIGIAAIVVISRREDRLPIKGSGPTQIIP
jgi:hypothetical protein